jgi:hypothetical protein
MERRILFLLIAPVFALFVLFSHCSGSKEEEEGKKRSAGDTEPPIERGRAIQKATFKALSSTLKEQIEKNGIEKALEFCSMKALAITDSLARAHGVQVRRVTDKPRNPYNALSEEEKRIFEEVRKKKREGKKLTPIIQRSDSSALYYAPIRIKKGLCLKCHGKKGTDIKPEHYARIRELYPEGKATGYEMGDLRGLWKIEMPLKEQELDGPSS